MLTGDDRKYIAGIIGSENLDKLERDAKARGKALAETGLSFKFRKASDDTDDDEDKADDEENSDDEDKADDDEDKKKKKPQKTSAPEVGALKVLLIQAIEAIEASNEIVKALASEKLQSEDRLGLIEQRLMRLNANLNHLIDPSSARSSKETLLEDDPDTEFLIGENYRGAGKGKGDRAPVSLIGKLAIQMGDDPKNYQKP